MSVEKKTRVVYYGYFFHEFEYQMVFPQRVTELGKLYIGFAQNFPRICNATFHALLIR